MAAQIGLFASTFAPQGPDTTAVLKILLDTFAIGYGLLGASVWNNIFKDHAIFKDKGNNHGWAKDSANAAVGSSVTIAKDAQAGVQGQVNTQNDLGLMLGKLVDGWASVTQTYMTNLFSGSDDALTQLDAYVNDGHWADTSFNNNSLDGLKGIMENVLYGQLIPQAWSDHTAVHPVVVFQQGSDNVNPLTAIQGSLRADAQKTLSDKVNSVARLMDMDADFCRMPQRHVPSTAGQRFGYWMPTIATHSNQLSATAAGFATTPSSSRSRGRRS